MKTFKKVLAGLTIIMVLCATTAILIPFLSPPLIGYSDLVAKKLVDEPEKYFVITNPDPALLQAISQSGEHVALKSFDETQIDELMSQYGTDNIEYQDSYYQVRIYFVDAMGWTNETLMLFWFSISGFILSLILLVFAAFVKGGLDNLKKQKGQQPQALT